MTSNSFNESKSVERAGKRMGLRKARNAARNESEEMNLFIGWKAVYKCEIANTYEISGVRGKKG